MVSANTYAVGNPDSFEEFVRDNTRVESSLDFAQKLDKL